MLRAELLYSFRRSSTNKSFSEVALRKNVIHATFANLDTNHVRWIYQIDFRVSCFHSSAYCFLLLLALSLTKVFRLLQCIGAVRNFLETVFGRMFRLQQTARVFGCN